MRIGEICTRSVVTCRRETGVRELAQLMSERHVGDAVVVEDREGHMAPVGVVTDRDLVVKILALGLDPSTVRAGDVMSHSVETAFESELVFDAVWHMRGAGIRRLPVLDAHNHLAGILTFDDVARFLSRQLADLTSDGARQTEKAR